MHPFRNTPISRRLASAAFAALLATVACESAETPASPEGHPWIGQSAPGFDLVSTTGERVSLDDFQNQKYLVLHFAASW